MYEKNKWAVVLCILVLFPEKFRFLRYSESFKHVSSCIMFLTAISLCFLPNLVSVRGDIHQSVSFLTSTKELLWEILKNKMEECYLCADSAPIFIVMYGKYCFPNSAKVFRYCMLWSAYLPVLLTHLRKEITRAAFALVSMQNIFSSIVFSATFILVLLTPKLFKMPICLQLWDGIWCLGRYL